MKDQVKYQKNIKDYLKELEEVEDKLREEIIQFPNVTYEDTPIGNTPNVLKINNTIIKNNKEFNNYNDFIKCIEDNTDDIKRLHPKTHIELCKDNDLTDFNSAVKTTGSKFVYLKNNLVLLEHALISYCINYILNRNNSFILIKTPDLAKDYLLEGCGFYPRDRNKSQIYKIETNNEYDDINKLNLIATSEIPLMGIYANEIIDSKDKLPIKYLGVSNCYRREAGRGIINKGLYRLHQFQKVEMFAYCENNLKMSNEILEEFVNIQAEILSNLGLTYKILEMNSEDIGISAYRKIDIEVFFPSTMLFGEVSSASNCTDFQSRRLNAKYIDYIASNTKSNKKFLHTINATALATPRIMMAILEYYQTKEGKIEVPNCLKNHMYGVNYI